jgi:thiamine biosynthesis lipoprotein
VALRLATAAMGTRFELVLEDGDRAAGEAALEVVESWDQRLSAFRRDSLVSRVNRAGGPVRLDEQTYGLFETCLALWRSTVGAFDVGLGAREAAGGPPYELDRDARTIRLSRAGARLDLGAVGKGFALDLAADELREAGVRRALMHGGTSSSIAVGAPPGRSGWGVAITGEDDRVVSLRDASLSVSAPHGRVTDAGGHVIDPATGAATAPGPIVAVTSPSGTLADAWATALAVHVARGAELPPLPPSVTLVLAERRELTTT